jgi:hypothetical protein
MNGIQIRLLDGRLRRRYAALVKQHFRAATSVSAGLASLPGAGRAATCAQALWRFLANERVTLPALVEPPRELARQVVNGADYGSRYVLLAHDWSKLTYPAHRSKRDQVGVSHERDRGYELTASLLVDAERGVPVAPMELQLWSAEGVHTTRQDEWAPRVGHLEQALPTMRSSRTWGLSPEIVHVIDRESDSLVDWREWHADGHLFLSRSDHDRKVPWRGGNCTLREIGLILASEGAFQFTRTVQFHGRTAELFVSETKVTIKKPGRRRTPAGRINVPGPPLTLRLVLTEVRDEDGQALARWYLMTNVLDTGITADLVALWYYWRWRIETYFKLLKSAGLQLEHWQQESAEAIAKRLLVASMACVLVWQLERDTTPPAEQCKTILMRLSGRQTKRTRRVTASGLLVGLERWLAVRDLLEHHTPAELDQLIGQVVPFLARTNSS